MSNEPNVLEVDFGENGAKLTLNGPEEVQAWLQSESAKWQWLSQPQDLRVQTEEIRSAIEARSQAVQTRITQWQRATDPSARARTRADLENQLKHPVETRQLLLSTSPEGRFVLELVETRSPVIAAGALLAFLEKKERESKMRMPLIEGAIEASLFRKDLEHSGAVNQQILAELSAKYDGGITEQKRRLGEIESANTALNGEFRTRLEDHAASLAQLRRDREAEFQAAFAKHEQKLQELEDVYNKKLALQQPVSYWKDKAAEHSKRAMSLESRCKWIGFLLCIVLAAICWRTLGTLDAGENPKHWQVGVVLLAAFAAIWIMRILVRLYFSHVHLHSDACERQTMILTYLAIAREGSQFEPKDKSIILERLFRPATDGVVRDDATPPTLLEYFSRSKG